MPRTDQALRTVHLDMATPAIRATVESKSPSDAAPPSLRPVAVSKRQPELDALRGLLLVWMTLTHLPTHASYYSNQTFGFVSAAEGFIFLSALLCGRIFGRRMREKGPATVVRQLEARAARLYGYHLFLLAVAFTVVAKIAVHTGQPSLQGLVDFYLAHPVRGVFASLLLIYQPPLLDILPMYIVFLVLTPLALWAGSRWNWRVVLIPSVLIWAGAQVGLKSGIYWCFVHATHIDIPFSALGAFDFFGWQFLWVAGLWIGIGCPKIVGIGENHRLAVWAALALAIFFAIVRHTACWDVMNSGSWVLITDKWHLGALRLLNFSCLAILFSTIQPQLAKWLSKGPLVLLGRASLEVFCAHLLICFAALAMVGEGAGLPFWPQVAIVFTAVIVLYGVAKFMDVYRRKNSGVVAA